MDGTSLLAGMRAMNRARSRVHPGTSREAYRYGPRDDLVTP